MPPYVQCCLAQLTGHCTIRFTSDLGLCMCLHVSVRVSMHMSVQGSMHVSMRVSLHMSVHACVRMCRCK